MTDTQPRERERVRERVRVKSKNRRRRRRIAWLVGVLGALGALVGLGLIPAFAARSSLVEGREHIETARDALAQGDTETAAERFEQSAVSFIKAADQARNPVLRLFGLIPIAGRTPDAVLALAESGGEVARAGVVVADALSEIPGGFSALAPQGGTIAKEPLEILAPALDDASILVRSAQQRVEALPHSWLLPSVSDAREELGVQLAVNAPRIQATAALVEGLPAFLGYEGERRYFFGASNPAEVRGTGGFLGAYSILTTDQGEMSFSPFRSTQALPDPPPEDIPPPNEGYATRYPGAWTFWVNTNLTPDFPSAAVAIERLYQHVEGDALDGVIVADPYALEALMEVSGAVEVPVLNRAVEPDEIVNLTTNQAYSELTNPAARKLILGEVAGKVVDRFLKGGTSPELSARALVDATSDGHVRIHSTDDALQEGLNLVAMGGALLRPDGDYVGLSFNNAAGNKLDFYAYPTVDYDVRLGAAGTARSDVTVQIENRAPSSGPPAYVIGPFDERFDPGENVTAISAFLPGGAVFEGAEVNGAEEPVFEARELGHVVVEREISIPSGETGTVEFSVASPSAWEGTEGAGTYRLTLQVPPTMNPVRANLDIQAPEGVKIVWTSVPMDVRGNRARWSGVASTTTTFELRFQKGFLSRTWEGISDWFEQPLIGHI